MSVSRDDILGFALAALSDPKSGKKERKKARKGKRDRKRRSKSSQEDEDGSQEGQQRKKLRTLPPPRFGDPDAETDPGPLRRIGDYPTYVHLQVDATETLLEYQKACVEDIRRRWPQHAQGLEVFSDFHSSLSRNLQLRYPEIRAFVNRLAEAFTESQILPFRIRLSGYGLFQSSTEPRKTYFAWHIVGAPVPSGGEAIPNRKEDREDEKTEEEEEEKMPSLGEGSEWIQSTSPELNTGSRHNVLSLIRIVNSCAEELDQPTYFENPLPHVSFACLPESVENLMSFVRPTPAEGSRQQESNESSAESSEEEGHEAQRGFWSFHPVSWGPSITLNITEAICKVGQYIYRLRKP